MKLKPENSAYVRSLIDLANELNQLSNYPSNGPQNPVIVVETEKQ